MSRSDALNQVMKFSAMNGNKIWLWLLHVLISKIKQNALLDHKNTQKIQKKIVKALFSTGQKN